MQEKWQAHNGRVPSALVNTKGIFSFEIFYRERTYCKISLKTKVCYGNKYFLHLIYGEIDWRIDYRILFFFYSNYDQNPILYCIMHKSFKSFLLKIIKCHCRKIRWRRQNTVSTEIRKQVSKIKKK